MPGLAELRTSLVVMGDGTLAFTSRIARAPLSRALCAGDQFLVSSDCCNNTLKQLEGTFLG